MVWLSTGPNTFASPRRLLLNGIEPRGIAINDRYTDGSKDILVANAGSHNITRFRLDGNGDHTPAELTALADGATPVDLVTADFNQDGIGDVATANEAGNTVSILLGTADGPFGNPVNIPTSAGPRSICAGDFDGDGDVDLATANRNADSLTILQNDGAGGFATTFDEATGSVPRAVVAVDINGDNRDDLIATSPSNGAIALHQANSQGGFNAAVFLTVDGNPTRVAVGDYTDDGKIDLLAVLFASDTATIASGQLVCLAGDGAGTFAYHTDFQVAPGVVALIADDMNRDGNTDLVFSNNADDYVGTALGNGTGLATERRFPVGTRPRMAAPGDFNRDGNVDLLVANLDSNDVTFLPGDGTGGFSTGTSIPAGGSARAIATAHLNSDSNLDFVVTNLNESRVAVFLGQGNGSFQAPAYFDVRDESSTRSAEPRSVVLDDINGDTHVDLVVGNANRDSVAVLLGTGTGTFSAPVEYDVGNFPLSVKLADFDENGTLDMIVANGVDADGEGTQTSSLHLLLGAGDGTFDEEDSLGYLVNAAPGALMAQDFTRDGHIDVATSHSTLGSIQITNGRGDGRFGGGSVFAMGTNPNSITTADFNKDGALDLVATNTNGHVSIRLYDRLLGFGSRTAIPIGAGTGPIEVLVHDLNGDGHLDLVTPNRTSDDVSVVLGAAP